MKDNVRASNEVIPYLREHGPSTLAELPSHPNTVTIQTYDIRKIKLSSSPATHIGFQNVVYYLAQEHDPETVVRKYVEVNNQVLDELPLKTITDKFNNVDPSFGPAWKRVADDYDVRIIDKTTAGGDRSGDTCPYCNTDIEHSLRYHLPCEQSK